MEIVLNENCIYHRDDLDVNNILNFLNECAEMTINQNIIIYSDIEAFKSLAIELSTNTQYLNILVLLLKKLSNYDKNPNPRHYYYYFKHQDYGLSVDLDISSSSLSYASDKILNRNLLVVLNIPQSHYCIRQTIPVIKSSYDSTQNDQIAIIPCFNNIRKLISHYVFNFKLINFIDHDSIPTLLEEYRKVMDNFNFNSWQPSSFLSSTILDTKYAFPANGNDYLSSFFSKLKITIGGNYRENVAKYIELGSILLNLNGYTKNFRISSKYNREIFEGGYGNKKLLISLDTENGLFEVINHTGTHIGVYNYGGVYKKHYVNQEDINSHSLTNLNPNLFLFH